MISFSPVMRLLRLLFLALAAVVASARADDRPLARLTTALTGNFTTADQTAIDPTYRHVLLHAVPIWTDHAAGPWFYLEQALADAPDLPFRQRVCQFVEHRFGAAPLYARIDMVTAANGESQLMEVELTEPSLYLHTDPVAPDRVASALVSAVAAAQR